MSYFVYGKQIVIDFRKFIGIFKVKKISAFLVILIFNIKMSYVKTIAKKIYSYSQK